ncbi:hypothetical protein [Muricoccus radiodurans]|uniref:hypothetical protein n=1 Tax=Muricoccus radiodurans TaxID=2231721 RepID=UPI003CEB7BCA
MMIRRSLLTLAAPILGGLPRSAQACAVPAALTIANRGTRPIRALRLTERPLSAGLAGRQGQAQPVTDEVPVTLPSVGLAPGQTIVVNTVNCRARYTVVATFTDGRVVQVDDLIGRQEVVVR